jgi:hypothetical protein
MGRRRAIEIHFLDSVNYCTFAKLNKSVGLISRASHANYAEKVRLKTVKLTLTQNR